MRTRILALLVLCFAGCYGYAQLRTETKAKVALDEGTSRLQPVASAAAAPLANAEPAARVDFATQIKPLLDPKCQPCHFNGGKVYASMPFDRPQTIKTLGTKLFTRIKDEQARQLIREFLAQP
jgi:hypothetical protein